MFCFVLTPFNERALRITNEAIRPAFQEIKRNDSANAVQWEVNQANDIKLHNMQKNKVKLIEESIKKSSLLVANITSYSPNVMWELGYAQALRKNVIILCEENKGDIKALPFNIRVDDVIFYKHGTFGINKLRERLTETIKSRLDDLFDTLHQDTEITSAIESIEQKLPLIRRSDFTKRFCLYELKRAAERTAHIVDGRFVLRNERPTPEILEFFKKSFYNLAGKDAKFRSISCLDFWRLVTDEGNNFAYAAINVQAAQDGAMIERVILVDDRDFKYRRKCIDEVKRKFLQQIYTHFSPAKDRIKTKLHFTSDYSEKLSTYGNFGVLETKRERAMFKPEYTMEGDKRRMSYTNFHLCPIGGHNNDHSSENCEIISVALSNFKSLWENPESVELAEYHFK